MTLDPSADLTHVSLTDSVLAGQYVIAREIGRGGMATVYLAHDRKHDRDVAVKVLRSDLSASLGAERFAREIAFASRLTHPHIVPLLDSGNTDGLFYYVSLFVGGGSLRERLQQSRQLPIADALRIAQEVGGALDYAHRVGVLHRDVKPENILFLDGHAMLTDFGIARACDARTDDNLTLAGIAVGTPDYMSPEQASGDTALSSASDIYSLACVVFEMLAGEPPFASSNARQTLARQIVESARSVRGHRPDVPLSVEQALDVALRKEPSQRFRRAADFVAALTAPSTPATPSRAGRTRAVAVLPFVNASPDPDNEYLSDGLTDELIDALSKVRGLRVASRSSTFALKGKSLDARAIGALLGVAELLEGTVRKSGNKLRVTAQLTSVADGQLLWSERYDREFRDVFALQDEIARTIVNTLRGASFADLSEPLPHRYTENLTAYGLYLRGRFAWNKRTQEGSAGGISYFEQAIAADPSYAPAYAGLSDSYALQVDYRSVPVAEGFQRAIACARKAIELDDSLAEAHASLAWALFIYGWDWDQAEAEFRRALTLDPASASAHQWYSMLLTSRGAHQEALIEAHTALELDPASVSIRRSVGWTYYYARRFEQARHHLDRAVSMNPTAEESYRILGMTLFALGQAADAERVLRESLGLPGAGPYAVAALGYVLASTGQHDEAGALLQQLERQAATGYVSPVAFALLHLGLGDLRRAMDSVEQAHRERRGWLAYMSVHPVMDPLRGDPRVQALMGQMHFATVQPATSPPH